MTKIIPFTPHNLRNNEHFQFMTEVDQLVTVVPTELLPLNNVYPRFKEALTLEDEALRVEQGSLKTETLGESDVRRDQIWSALRGRVESTLLSPVAEESESAKVLMRVIDLYGNVRQMAYKEETSALTNLVSDLLLPVNEEHLNRLGIQAWVTALKNENDQFQAITQERVSELAGRKEGDVRGIRLTVDPIYQELVDTLNAAIILNVATPEAQNLVKELNVVIKAYKTLLATRSGRKDAKEKMKEV
ncbi:DUF6261 family protein [uncultured Sunxiuqinia sp.]|uniref:DUF6261 family protein n=1 Tax=uncultured Sunxiuqinia sp. TaxID=1573825 RepID=UPI002637364A|nr:DUF6261 family protein [uncultured Sunxiuqinia sp.]